MDHPSGRREIEINEGYRVEADAEGLRVVVTDYHAPPLQLTYRMIHELRSGVGAPARAEGNVVLLLSKDERLGRSLLDGLAGIQVTWTRSCDEARTLLATCPYRLAILAGLGMSPIDAMTALPRPRSFPCLLLASWRDPDVLRECAHEDVEVLVAPFETDAVREAVRSLLESPFEAR